VIVEPNVVRAASELPSPAGSVSPARDPPAVPQVANDVAGQFPKPVAGGESTSPPPEVPQRSVAAGTITQAWDASSPVSLIRSRRDVTHLESPGEITYQTAYGVFSVTKGAPAFIRVFRGDGAGDKVADSAFLVMYQGQLLLPGAGAESV